MMFFWLFAACASDLKYVSDLDRDGFTISDGDCDDSRAGVNPATVEVCLDGIDNNCNGLIDEEGAQGSENYFLDNDGDGFGDPSDPIMACGPPSALHVFTGGDCDDDNPDVHPSASEVCNEIDDNCNDLIDDDDTDIEYSDSDNLYLDDDGDGYGASVSGDALQACSERARYVRNDEDCNDSDANINPDADELCATVGIDDNCDGIPDNSASIDLLTWYFDSDGDGFGAGDPILSCTEMTNYSSSNQDCYDIDDGLGHLIFPNSHAVESPEGSSNAFNDIDCDGDEACKDLQCDSRIELYMPTYPEVGNSGMNAESLIYSVADTNELVSENGMGFEFNAFLSAGAVSPVHDGYRKLAFTQMHPDCSGSLFISEIVANTGLSNTDQILFNPITSLEFTSVGNNTSIDLIATVGTHPLYPILDICPGDDDGPYIVQDLFSSPTLDMLMIGGHKSIVEDFNGDGELDIALCRGLEDNGLNAYSSSLIVWGPNWGANQTTPLSTPNCGDLIAADMDDDGDLDLVLATASEDGFVDSRLYKGPDFLIKVDLDVRASAKVIAGDFDSDGLMDLVFGQNPIGIDWNRDVPVYWGFEGLAFQEVTTVEAMGCIYPQIAEAGNGEGLDLICPNLKGYVNVQTNEYDVNGSLTQEPPSYIYWGAQNHRYNELSRKSLHPGGALHALSGDFNENGMPDLLFTPWFSSQYRMYWDNPNDAPQDYTTDDLTRQLNGPLAIGSGF